MRFAILGSGAVGGYFGARLCRAGHDVTFIARGAHLAALRERGIEIRSPLGNFVTRGAAEEDTARVGAVDCVLVAVKGYDNATALPMLPPLLGPRTSVLTLQNGVESIDDCAAIVGEDRVLGGATYVFATLEAPGRIVETGTTARIVFGEVYNPSAEISTRVAAIGAAFAEAGIEAQTVRDARVPLWEKLSYLAPFSGLTAASRAPIGAIWHLSAVREAFLGGVGEVARVAEAEGVSLPTSLADRHLQFVGSLALSSRSSLLMDLLQGRRLELEALQGSVVRRGRRAGVATPVIATLYAVLKAYEHGALRA